MTLAKHLKLLGNLSLFLALILGAETWTGAWGETNAASAQNPNTALTIRADAQEANAKTGIITAKGNVQMTYPARQIKATSAQAQYFSQERRIVLSGNVVVLQQGNSLKADTITYLIDEGKFQAVPQSDRQVESVYIVPDDTPTTAAASATPARAIKPAFKSNVSPATPVNPGTGSKSSNSSSTPAPQSLPANNVREPKSVSPDSAQPPNSSP